MTKVAIFENSRWRTADILKMVSSPYLSRADHPISMKFGVPLAAADFGSKDGHVAHDKVSKVCKFKMADGRHIKNRFGYISTNYCTINAKFNMKKQNYVQRQVT